MMTRVNMPVNVLKNCYLSYKALKVMWWHHGRCILLLHHHCKAYYECN